MMSPSVSLSQIVYNILCHWWTNPIDKSINYFLGSLMVAIMLALDK